MGKPSAMLASSQIQGHMLAASIAETSTTTVAILTPYHAQSDAKEFVISTVFSAINPTSMCFPSFGGVWRR